MQTVSDAAQNPTAAKVIPAITVGFGWSTINEWLPLVAGVFASLIGAIASIFIIKINWAQHKIKMEILKRDLAERDFRIGRKDRRDD